MIDKKFVLIGVTIAALTIYKIATFKIGPCSPELEVLLNNR